MQSKNILVLPELTPAMQARLEDLPPTVSFSQLAGILKRPAGTVRKQAARGTLGIPVHRKPGGSPYLLLNDIELFLRGGHEALEVEKRKPGRPTNTSRAAARQQRGANA